MQWWRSGHRWSGNCCLMDSDMSQNKALTRDCAVRWKAFWTKSKEQSWLLITKSSTQTITHLPSLNEVSSTMIKSIIFIFWTYILSSGQEIWGCEQNEEILLLEIYRSYKLGLTKCRVSVHRSRTRDRFTWASFMLFNSTRFPLSYGNIR